MDRWVCRECEEANEDLNRSCIANHLLKIATGNPVVSEKHVIAVLRKMASVQGKLVRR